MTQDPQHFDVAAYALGVLDPRDAERFEAHLADCDACAIELDSMLPVVDVLADIDADSLVATEQSRREGLVLNRMINVVGHERRRTHGRRLYSLAAAVVAFAVLGVGAAFAGGQWFARADTTTASPKQSALEPIAPESNVGGPNAPKDITGVTDPRTGVRAAVALEQMAWGTQVDLALTNIKGPKTCRLVAVRTDGTQEVLSSWTVGEKGWGTAAQPKALELTAQTALPRNQIAHVKVDSMDETGTPQTLVRVP